MKTQRFILDTSFILPLFGIDDFEVNRCNTLKKKYK